VEAKCRKDHLDSNGSNPPPHTHTNGFIPALQEAARCALDDAIATAVGLLDVQRQEGGEEDRAVAAMALDAAIERATQEGVSAKYAKKVRRRMQGGPAVRPAAEESSGAYPGSGRLPSMLEPGVKLNATHLVVGRCHQTAPSLDGCKMGS